MSEIVPLVQFKAGLCEVDESSTPWKIKPKATPGFIYLYREEDLAHFCWRPRAAPLDAPGDDALDLIMFPDDGHFEAWTKGKTNGRIYRLSFESSSNKHFFWLQSKNQHPDDKPDHWSERDHNLGKIVTEILSGQEVDVSELHQGTMGAGGPGGDDDGDEEMRDVEDEGPAAGGAGSGATGGDFREEGEESREGGEDGARASFTRAAPSGQSSTTDASEAVANLLRSLQGNPNLADQGQQQSAQGKLFTTLPDLLQPATTVPVAQAAADATVNEMLSLLPPQLLLLAQEADDLGSVDPNPETTQAALQALTTKQKRDTVTKVLRSPQFSQSLASLTAALRDGGLPTISEALKIKVENGGYIRHGAVPLGGGEAVEAFLKGIRATVEKEELEKGGSGDSVETD